MQRKVIIILIMLASTLLNFAEEKKESGSLIISFEDIKYNEGKLIMALHNINNSKYFPARHSKDIYKTVVIEIKDRKAIIRLDEIPYGSYAIAVFHDKNSNDKMDTNFIGIPEEGYGFSNNAEVFLGPPSFDSAKLDIKSAEFNTSIKMKY